MGIFTYDAVTIIQDLITNKWKDIRPPRISAIWDKRSVGFMDDRRDFILISPENEDPQYFGLYGQDFLHQISVRIEIHSFQNLEHHENLVNEIFRIVKENIRRTDFIDLLLDSSSHENDMYRNIYRHVINVRYRKLNP